MGQQDWTDSRIATLRREWVGDKTAREIGEMIGMSRGAVIGKAQRLGLQTSEARRRKKISKGMAARKDKPPPPPKLKPKPKARPRPAPVLTIVPSAAVPLIEAGEFQCRYPVDGEGAAMRVCGAEVHQIGDWRSGFCPGHHARCYQPPTKRRREQSTPPTNGRLTQGLPS